MINVTEAHPCRRTIAYAIGQVADYPAEDVTLAIEILCRFGPPVTELLLAAAARPSIPVVGTYRLLVLAQQIGGDNGLAGNRHLLRLRHHWCAAVRMKAEELLAALRQRRRS